MIRIENNRLEAANSPIFDQIPRKCWLEREKIDEDCPLPPEAFLAEAARDLDKQTAGGQAGRSSADLLARVGVCAPGWLTLAAEPSRCAAGMEAAYHGARQPTGAPAPRARPLQSGCMMRN